MEIDVLELGPGAALVPGGAAMRSEAEPPAPLVRASRAWMALKTSTILESLAFLARGVEYGRAPRGAACPKHVVGPLVGTVIGPAGGCLPPDAVEELFQRAAIVRGVSMGEWSEWRRVRFTPELLEDVTMLAHRGACRGRSYEVRCTCGGSQVTGDPLEPEWRLRNFDPVLGPVPALVPDPTGQTDPWQDSLIVLASTFRGRGSQLSSQYSGSGPASVSEVRALAVHLDRLAGAFAGPRRADRMAGLGRIDWDPPLQPTLAWHVLDTEGSTERAREELRERLRLTVGV